MTSSEDEVMQGSAKRSPPSPSSSSVGEKKARLESQPPVFDPDQLRVYYSRLFPSDAMFKWLSYGNQDSSDTETSFSSNNIKGDKDYFSRREFSFTLENDVYCRYLSFRDAQELEKELVKKVPHKIDIGAVYNVNPKNHGMVKGSAFKPMERELVFDIDLTDYDDVRLGCTPDMMWEKGSWLYMSVAIKLMDKALREDFGFQHLLWVFSGRRGIHCWVCDASARQLEDKERTAIVNYLTLITGNDGNKVQISSPLHPSLQRAMPLLEDVFEKMVLSKDGQDLLGTPEKYEKVLAYIPDSSIQDRLRSAWTEDPDSTSMKRWKQLRATVLDVAKRQKGPSALGLKKAIHTIVIIFTYPRLDVNVSTHRNHLLKSPFVVHPKTGKVCVPILDVDQCENFNPDSVPMLSRLVEELDSKASGVTDRKAAMQQTQLWPFVDGFNKTFLKPLYRSIRQESHDVAQQHAAAVNDW